MNQTAKLVQRLRDLADALERLEAEQPLPHLYITISTPFIEDFEPNTDIQVSALASGLTGYAWATDIQRLAAAKRIQAETGWHAYAPIDGQVSA